MIEITFISKTNLPFFEPFIPEDAADWRFLGRSIMLGAIMDGVACGFTMLVISDDMAEIRGLKVASGYDREAVIDALVGFITDHMNEFGVSYISSSYVGDDADIIAIDRVFISRGYSLSVEACRSYRLTLKDLMGSEMAARVAANKNSMKLDKVKTVQDIPRKTFRQLPAYMQTVLLDKCDPHLSRAYIENGEIKGLVLVCRKSDKWYKIEDLYTIRPNPMVVMSLFSSTILETVAMIKGRKIDAASELTFQMTEERSTDVPERLLNITSESVSWYHIAEMVSGDKAV